MKRQCKASGFCLPVGGRCLGMCSAELDNTTFRSNPRGMNDEAAILGLKWHGPRKGSQEPVLKAFREHRASPEAVKGLVVKYTNFYYASSHDRESFIQDYLLQKSRSLPLYELVPECERVRLYFDLEQPYQQDEPVPTDADWFGRIWDLLKRQLASVNIHEDHFEKVVVSNSSARTSKGGYKMSFHLTFPSIDFKDNHTHMRSFVETQILPAFRSQRVFMYVAEYKKGPEVVCVVDNKVYTRNRAFRMPYASKEPGKPQLLPWDIKSWSPICFANDGCEEVWLEQSLLTGYDNEEVCPIECDPQRLTPAPQRAPRVTSTLPLGGSQSRAVITHRNTPPTRYEKIVALAIRDLHHAFSDITGADIEVKPNTNPQFRHCIRVDFRPSNHPLARTCHIGGKSMPHKSNRNFFCIDIRRRTVEQKCFDNDCQKTLRSNPSARQIKSLPVHRANSLALFV